MHLQAGFLFLGVSIFGILLSMPCALPVLSRFSGHPDGQARLLWDHRIGCGRVVVELVRGRLDPAVRTYMGTAVRRRWSTQANRHRPALQIWQRLGAMLLAATLVPPTASGRRPLKLSSKLARAAAAGTEHLGPQPLREHTRRLQTVDECNALFTAADQACNEFICSAECTRAVHYAKAEQTACNTDPTGNRGTSADPRYIPVLPLLQQSANFNFQTGIDALQSAATNANCVNLCEYGNSQGNPVCNHGATCAGVVAGIGGYASGNAGYTCDCSVESALGYTGPTCVTACHNGVVGNTAQSECNLCPDGTEPNHTHTACLPCRPGTYGTGGECNPCPGGKRPASHSCIDKCNTYTDQNTCVANQGSGCTYDAYRTPSCATNQDNPCGGYDLSASSGVTGCEDSAQCEYIPALTSCVPCPTLTFSSVGICEKCPLGFRPNQAQDACLPMPPRPSSAINPRAVVELKSTATVSGEFSTGIILPSIVGIAEAYSDQTISVEATADTIAQNASFRLSFVSTGTSGVADLPPTIYSQASRVRHNFEQGSGGVTMLANSLGATLNVPPSDVVVKRIRVGDFETFEGRWFSPPISTVPVMVPNSSPPVVATVTLAGSANDVGADGSAIRLAFERDFVIEMSQSIQIEASRIHVTGVSAGSIIVSFEIANIQNAAKTADAGLVTLRDKVATGEFALAGYNVSGVSNFIVDYGEHPCAVIIGMSTCTSGSCVVTGCAMEADGRRRAQASFPRRQLQTENDVPVDVEFEVTGSRNVATLLASSQFGATFSQLLKSEGMTQNIAFTGSCECPSSDQSGQCVGVAGAAAASEAACVFQEFAGHRFAADFTFLVINDTQGNAYPEPYDRPAFTDAENLLLCKEICQNEPTCTSFVFQPSAGRSPRVAGCSFGSAQITDICVFGVSCGVVDDSNPTWYNLYVDLRTWTGVYEPPTSYFYDAINISVTDQITTVMPYTVTWNLDGEDSNGVANVASLLSNAALFSSVLLSAASAVQSIMMVTAVSPVQTTFSTSCPSGQWFKDPYCYSCEICQPGFEKIANCNSTSNAICSPCSAVDGFPTHYSLDGLQCLPCNAPCRGGIEHEAVPCTPTSNRQCDRCPHGTVASRVCDWKKMSKVQPYRLGPDSNLMQERPELRSTGWYKCPWKCLGNQKPKLQRTYGVDTANFPEGHPRAQSPEYRSKHARAHGDGFYGFTCKGRDVTGQRMWEKTSGGRICAPQKNIAEGRPTSSSSDVISGLANDGDQVSSCVCIREPDAWWSVELPRTVANATIYVHANDCCANTTLPRPIMTLKIGGTANYADASACGTYRPSSFGSRLGVLRCVGTGRHIFVSSPGELALAEIQVFDLGQLDVGIGHPKESIARSQRGGVWVDDSPDGITSRLGTYALDITPHKPYFDRFSNEFQSAGEQHVTQEHHLVGEFGNRPVYTGTHVSSSDCSHLERIVQGGTENLTDPYGVSCGRTSRRWDHTEEGPYGSKEAYGPTGMKLGMVEVLTDYTRDNPIHVGNRPVTALEAAYISAGQRPGYQLATSNTAWQYVEEFGWLLDKTWFTDNVRKMPDSAANMRQSELTDDDKTKIAAAKASFGNLNSLPSSSG